MPNKTSDELLWKEIKNGEEISHFPSSQATNQIYVKRTGNYLNERFKIVFLHDFCQHHDHFLKLVKHLNEEDSFYFLDFVGHGLSSGTRGHFDKFEYLVKDVLNFLLKINVNQRNNIIILGHGLGGLVALDLINKYQDRSDKMIKGLIISNFSLNFENLIFDFDKKILKNNSILRDLLSKLRPIKIFKGKDLLSTPQKIMQYEGDPLIVHRPTINAVREIDNKMKNLFLDSYFINVKIFFLLSDTFTRKSRESMEYFIKGIKKELITEKNYFNLRHDLYNERDNREIFSDIENWIKNEIK